MRTAKIVATVLTLAAGLALGVASAAAPPAASTRPAAAAAAAAPTRAVAVLIPTKGNTAIAGTIIFDKTDAGIHVHGTITGLAPNTKHGFHIHEFGDASSDDGMSAGGHFNPEGHQHGGPTSPMHHAGDMGNVTADASGKATVDLTIADVTLVDGKMAIVGHGVVVHAGEDNMMPNANPGARLAVGVIGLAKGQ